jgi:transposase
MDREKIEVTRKQMIRYDVLKKANGGVMTVKEAAAALGLSERQIKRLKKKVEENGVAALKHGSKGTASSKRVSDETKAEILRIRKTEPYCRSNFKHFGELLAEHHDIELSYPTLSRILKRAGITSPKTRRKYKPHRKRKRRPQAGVLVQVDATPYAWFSGDKKKYGLHGCIDDATGQITALYMCQNECLQGYFEMLRRTIHNYGVPVSLYADRHTIFQSPNKDKAEIDPKISFNDTQFGRCLKELGIELIGARSPQAKGRIERLWVTLQDRLPIEFSIRNIETMDAANAFFKNYIYAYNIQFAVEPENADSLFSKLPESFNLDYTLCIKEVRTLDGGGVFAYGGKHFKVCEDKRYGLLPPKCKINVLVSPIFGVKAEYRNTVYDAEPFIAAKRSTAESMPAKPHKSPLPVPDTHYHKYGKYYAPTIAYTESNEEIMDMLYDIFFKKF